MIESSIQENGTMEFGFNFPIAFTTLLENLIVIENICCKKSSKVSVCGTKELESNGMQIQHECLHKLTNSRGALSYATTCTQMKHLALKMVKGDVQN
jgi:hypothetical protein